MRLLADLHIAPRTVQFLRSLGHDVLRVTDLLPATASDETIVERAAQDQRIILTQDLDMTAIIGEELGSGLAIQHFAARGGLLAGSSFDGHGVRHEY